MKRSTQIKTKANQINLTYFFRKLTNMANNFRNNILYIGLNGYAGAGKDTLAKALRIILENDFKTYREFKSYYDKHHGYETKNNFQYATYDKNGNIRNSDGKCVCIAFADQLKHICGQLFGIPVDRFYYNKSDAYVCVNHDFEYIETKPQNPNNIITANDYYYNHDTYAHDEDIKYWMSLREILVYVGTFVIQEDINKNAFVNIIRNTVFNIEQVNPDLSYVICTDVRFQHEVDFIKKKHGVLIKIVREGVETLENVAEHELDESDEDFDFIVDNSGNYDDLFKRIWEIVQKNRVFKNETITLRSRDNGLIYLREIKELKNGNALCRLCYHSKMNATGHNDTGKLSMCDPGGGPMIKVGDPVEIITARDETVIPRSIEFDVMSDGFIIEVSHYFGQNTEDETIH